MSYYPAETSPTLADPSLDRGDELCGGASDKATCMKVQPEDIRVGRDTERNVFLWGKRQFQATLQELCMECYSDMCQNALFHQIIESADPASAQVAYIKEKALEKLVLAILCYKMQIHSQKFAYK